MKKFDFASVTVGDWFNGAVVVATSYWNEDYSALLLLTREAGEPPTNYRIVFVDTAANIIERYKYTNICEAAGDWSNICGVRCVETYF